MDKLMGTGVALVTPFKSDLTVDTMALTNIVEHCIAGGVDYLVALGTTAETATLTEEEKQLVLETIVSANANRLPLVIGIGGNNTHAVIETIKKTDLSGFDAILSVSPYYNKPTQEGIYRHFKAIAENSPLPLIVYNVPSRTGSNMLPTTVLRLANDLDNVIGVKEASGDMSQVLQLTKDKPKGFMVISGDDMTALSTVLAGGSGVISVLAQGVPNAFSEMIRLGLKAEVKAAFELQYALQEGMGLIFQEGNPAGIKSVFEAMGLATSAVRLPLVPVSEGLREKIKQFVKPFAGLQV
ncbi:4-hydroxy-tetrahydrodipicolinate synthase [Maribacter polysaccharolyticus]|uniref:4-hydroxy-tetrahydrodipicolinate synthase n=1 Tax=Maribacter polysaccharolyticus TaxID=3020831 RepID=UPI00237EEF22|nr:4-hydroxy-tetrahydrodipicolinate synthase [Maribacter polysaccharolyticus]MDE3740660.1 4-hydroxy-tetrahydrodipicolinate synthase [Maribacter polysaccharolyticus]